MRRLLPAVILLMSGCSTAPIADFMDFFFTPRMPSTGRGGVCEPASPTPPAPVVPGRPIFPEPPPPEPVR